MRKFILLIMLLGLCGSVCAQKASSDSLAYQLQRKKINAMLDERRQKFGQYDESLTKHTGIFGLQTKKDIRRSNDILMDITKTDNSIFEEIKILLSYRTYQQQQVQTKSVEMQNNSLAYMNTINKLREQIDQLKKEALTNNQEHEKTQKSHVIVFVLMLGSILYLLMRKRAVKA